MFFLLCQRVSLVHQPRHGTCLLSTHLLFINSFPPWLGRIGASSYQNFHFRDLPEGIRMNSNSFWDSPSWPFPISWHKRLNALSLRDHTSVGLVLSPWGWIVQLIPQQEARECLLDSGGTGEAFGMCESRHGTHTLLATPHRVVKHFPACVQWNADFPRC